MCCYHLNSHQVHYMENHRSTDAIERHMRRLTCCCPPEMLLLANVESPDALQLNLDLCCFVCFESCILCPRDCILLLIQDQIERLSDMGGGYGAEDRMENATRHTAVHLHYFGSVIFKLKKSVGEQICFLCLW